MTKSILSAAGRGMRRLRGVLRFGRPSRSVPRNDTEHLLASPANAERLRAALRSSRAGGGERMGLDDLRERSGLGETSPAVP